MISHLSTRDLAIACAMLYQLSHEATDVGSRSVDVLPTSVGTLRSDDGDGKGNATKAIGLISKTTILHVHHAFLYISLPSPSSDLKVPSGFIAQLVEHRTGNREVTGSNPVEVLNFFSGLFRNCINCVHSDDHFFIFKLDIAGLNILPQSMIRCVFERNQPIFYFGMR